MIKTFMAFICALLFFITVGSATGAEMAKEGKGDYRSGKTNTPIMIAMGKERLQMNFNEIGVVVSAPENSPLHNASFIDIGSLHAIKGKWKGIGFAEWTRPNGDKVYATIELEGVFGGPGKSVLKFVGGTGSCTGIEGTMELGSTPGIKPAKKGVFHGISVGTFNWKIP